MENVEIIDIEFNGKTTQYVKIQRGDDEWTTMLKSTYDEMIAKQASQPNL